MMLKMVFFLTSLPLIVKLQMRGFRKMRVLTARRKQFCPSRSFHLHARMPLTRKQRAAVARAPKSQKARLANAYARQDRQRVKPRARNGGKELAGIKQGVGAITPVPFGDRLSVSPTCFNAFHPSHLPLPRAVGPYATIRTTQVIKTNQPFLVFGPQYQDRELTGLPSSAWTNTCAMGFVSLAAAMNAANNCQRYSFSTMTEPSWDFASVCPAAFSVQVMNPNAVQTTAGIVYQGRFRTVPRMIAQTSTVQDFADAWLTYNSPRLTSAAKLAFRGTHIDLVPYNMSKLSDFTGVAEKFTNTITLDITQEHNAGFAPCAVYNPDGIELQYLVCCEWRVRFDPSNPAQAAHVHHPVSSDWTWGKVVKALENGANGVRDIVETVANIGEFASRASRHLPMLGM